MPASNASEWAPARTRPSAVIPRNRQHIPLDGPPDLTRTRGHVQRRGSCREDPHRCAHPDIDRSDTDRAHEVPTVAVPCAIAACTRCYLPDTIRHSMRGERFFGRHARLNRLRVVIDAELPSAPAANDRRDAGQRRSEGAHMSIVQRGAAVVIVAAGRPNRVCARR